MANHSPKAITTALAQHWEVMERLCAFARELSSFELDEIARIIARTLPAKSAADHSGVLQDLSDRGLIQRLPRSDRRRVHPDVLTYVQQMTREHNLGLSEVIKVRVDKIEKATSTLQDAVAAVDRSGMVVAARTLAQQFDHISTQLEQDRHAIHEIAERAKAMDPSLPLVVRYRQVLEAYDQYVDPMVSMMDSGPGGIFNRHLQAAGESLDAAVQVIGTTHGDLATEIRILRDAAYHARELRRLGREVMNHCSVTLLPLRNALRDHSTLAASISTVVGLVRKRGARRVLTTTVLPFCVRDRYHKISAGPELRNIMAAALNYVAPHVDLPEEVEQIDPTPLDLVDLDNVRGQLAKEGGTKDLLSWIASHNPSWQDSTILAVFHDLSRPAGDKPVILASEPLWQKLNTINVLHYPVVTNTTETEPSCPMRFLSW